MILKPITTEKAVKLIDVENTLLFQTERKARRDAIKKEVESIFDVKVDKVRTLVRKNQKIAYVRLAKGSVASDVAARLGML